MSCLSWGFVRLLLWFDSYLFECLQNVFVIQSEAKDLEYINVDAPEILRHFVPLNDKNAQDDI